MMSVRRVVITSGQRTGGHTRPLDRGPPSPLPVASKGEGSLFCFGKEHRMKRFVQALLVVSLTFLGSTLSLADVAAVGVGTGAAVAGGGGGAAAVGTAAAAAVSSGGCCDCDDCCGGGGAVAVGTGVGAAVGGGGAAAVGIGTGIGRAF